MCIVKIVSIICDVKCPVCVIPCIYSLHSFIENTFNFMIKILGHILTFFLGKGVYIHYLMSIPTCKKNSWLKISTIMNVIIFIFSVC